MIGFARNSIISLFKFAGTIRFRITPTFDITYRMSTHRSTTLKRDFEDVTLIQK